jgi:hypothetical protein
MRPAHGANLWKGALLPDGRVVAGDWQAGGLELDGVLVARNQLDESVRAST